MINVDFIEILYSANSAFKSSVFEPDQTDTFYLIWPALGKIDALHLSVQPQTSNKPWFCEYISIEDNEKKDQYK